VPDPDGKHVLILGAGGFVGRNLVRALHAKGAPVIAATRSVVTEWPVETVSGVFDRPAHFAPLLARARVVVHVASVSTPGQTAGRPLEELNGNLTPTLSLLAALQEAPHCDFLYLSSGGTLYGDTGEHPAREEDPIRPRSYYGAGKAAAEHFIHAYAMQFSRGATIIRPGNLYGPGQTQRTGFGIIPAAFECIRSGRPLTIWGDGRAERDYLFIDDFVQLCLAIISKQMPQTPRVLNAASGKGVSLNSLIGALRDVTRSDLAVVYDSRRSVDVARIVLDPERAEREYGWVADTSLYDGLKQTWEWWRNRP
jgi:UDP-glucose 4-epimerase